MGPSPASFVQILLVQAELINDLPHDLGRPEPCGLKALGVGGGRGRLQRLGGGGRREHPLGGQRLSSPTSTHPVQVRALGEQRHRRGLLLGGQMQYAFFTGHRPSLCRHPSQPTILGDGLARSFSAFARTLKPLAPHLCVLPRTSADCTETRLPAIFGCACWGPRAFRTLGYAGWLSFG